MVANSYVGASASSVVKTVNNILFVLVFIMLAMLYVAI
jgi:hypothetical protein